MTATQKLEKYQRPTKEKGGNVRTSVIIGKRHKDYLDRNNLILSQVVRDTLDGMMVWESPTKKKTKIK